PGMGQEIDARHALPMPERQPNRRWRRSRTRSHRYTQQQRENDGSRRNHFAHDTWSAHFSKRTICGAKPSDACAVKHGCVAGGSVIASKPIRPACRFVRKWRLDDPLWSAHALQWCGMVMESTLVRLRRGVA